MANIPIWPGSSSFFPGATPFGFYDSDLAFQSEADKFAVYASQRLGYPIVDVELQDIQFYTALEEAVTTYGNELYAYQIRQDYLNLEGGPTGSDLNNTLVTPNMNSVIRMSEQYGTEAGVGGNITWKTGSINLIPGQQTYDLNAWALTSASLDPGDSIEIMRVFYYAPPAIVKYFDPYASTGVGMTNLVDTFGWGNYSPAINFLLMPINFDLQKLQAIEFNDQIRKSNYSFEIQNNQLRVFPIPTQADIGGKMNFQYIKNSERYTNNLIAGGSGAGGNSAGNPGGSGITNVSNVPYNNPVYTQINSVGRSWIYEYALALCKEMLGYVRGKYGTLPIPNAEVTMNQGDLISAATSEKTTLIDKLRGYLDETSRDKLLERKAQEAEYKQKELAQVPYVIYIG